jgi:hypothetical protein
MPLKSSRRGQIVDVSIRPAGTRTLAETFFGSREEAMKALLATALVLAMAGPAAANRCPTLMKQIDAKLQTAQLSPSDKAKVTELRKEGEAAHKAGDHAKSEAALNDALGLLK